MRTRVHNQFKRVKLPQFVLEIIRQEAIRRGIAFDAAGCDLLTRCLARKGEEPK